MILNRYVFLLLFMLFISVGSTFLSLTRLNPFEDGVLALLLFYGSFFFLLSSSGTLFGYLMRVLLYPHEVSLNLFNVSLRQGIILALLILSLFIFQSFRRLFFWDALLLFLIAFLIEIYFVVKD